LIHIANELVKYQLTIVSVLDLWSDLQDLAYFNCELISSD